MTQQGGYLLRIGEGTLDYLEFDRLAEAGRIATEAGNHRLASEHFTRALAMWRGSALIDVRAGNVLQFEVLRMNESRMSVLQQRIDADIQIGRHTSLVPELKVLVAQNPLNENLCAQLMVAFQRMGCAWRALQTYQNLREALARELGLEPSALLQEIHHAVLVGEPARSRFTPHGSESATPGELAQYRSEPAPRPDIPFSVATR
ncbi:AfsR/SARP family transcriptional regulator [Streptomyces sp. NPDC055189]